ncbi:MAG TPA: DUF481 domain-containing protein, partial [Polyangiaceae bacterium]|nr:DUF481 domain-containing protein [Polyangiaceae bacterium]
MGYFAAGRLRCARARRGRPETPPAARAALAASLALATLTAAAEARAELRTQVDCFLVAGPVDCQGLKGAFFASMPYLREAREGEAPDVALGVRVFELARGYKYVLSFDGGPEGPRFQIVDRGVLAATSPDGALTALEADLQKGLAPFLGVRAAATTVGGVTTLLLGDPSRGARPAEEPDSARWYLGIAAEGSVASGTTSSLFASGTGEFNHSAEASRLNLAATGSVNRVRVQFGDGQSQSDSAAAWGGRALVARNVSEHWSVATRATYAHDTKNNLLADAKAEAGVSWDLVPLLATNDHALGARYVAGVEHQRYETPNVLRRRRATFLTHALDAYLTWHFADLDLTGDLYASSIVDDLRFASVSSSLSATFRLSERLSAVLGASASYRYALINQPRLAPESGL